MVIICYACYKKSHKNIIPAVYAVDFETANQKITRYYCAIHIRKLKEVRD